MVKEKDTVLSIKMSQNEKRLIAEAAKSHNETSSGFARRILLESAASSIPTNRDIMRILWDIGHDLQQLSRENQKEKIVEINTKGADICRILSLK